MTTAAGSLQIVPESPPSAPALRAADQGVADALESVLSDNTRMGRSLARPQRQAGTLTADVLAVIRITAVQSRQRDWRQGH